MSGKDKIIESARLALMDIRECDRVRDARRIAQSALVRMSEQKEAITRGQR